MGARFGVGWLGSDLELDEYVAGWKWGLCGCLCVVVVSCGGGFGENRIEAGFNKCSCLLCSLPKWEKEVTICKLFFIQMRTIRQLKK